VNPEEILAALRQAMIDGDEGLSGDYTRQALDAGLAPLAIIEAAGSEAMRIVGEQFQCGEAYLPELITASEAMQASLEILLPYLTGRDSNKFRQGKVVLGTITGDLHDIGKNIVGALLTVNGFQIVDIGVDAPVKRFITVAEENGASIIGCSALLTTSMPYQRQLLRYAVDTGVRDKYYFILGGGSVTPEWVRQIGADGWAHTAAGAGELCRRLLESGIRPPLPEPILIGQ
jgi:methanogenic corrinoid protein MtbC1